MISFTLLPLYPRERDPGTRWIGDAWAPEPVWTRSPCPAQTVCILRSLLVSSKEYGTENATLLSRHMKQLWSEERF